MSVEEVMEIVEKDLVFYARSGGGITLSGGEVTMQTAFAAEILRQCGEKSIHTAIETCGFAPWEELAKILE